MPYSSHHWVYFCRLASVVLSGSTSFSLCSGTFLELCTQSGLLQGAEQATRRWKGTTCAVASFFHLNHSTPSKDSHPCHIGLILPLHLLNLSYLRLHPEHKPAAPQTIAKCSSRCCYCSARLFLPPPFCRFPPKWFCLRCCAKGTHLHCWLLSRLLGTLWVP